VINNYTNGRRDKRPWGEWETISVGKNFCVKKITVNCGGILSLQKHNHREENWVIVTGIGTVTLNGEEYTLKTGGSIYIPKLAVHRIENKEQTPLVFIEVQTGDILDENDIIRLEDKYNR
jgi:mannose-6-phosphate isomerase-like protein (cupin superfamily)